MRAEVAPRTQRRLPLEAARHGAHDALLGLARRAPAEMHGPRRDERELRGELVRLDGRRLERERQGLEAREQGEGRGERLVHVCVDGCGLGGCVGGSAVLERGQRRELELLLRGVLEGLGGGIFHLDVLVGVEGGLGAGGAEAQRLVGLPAAPVAPADDEVEHLDAGHGFLFAEGGEAAVEQPLHVAEDADAAHEGALVGGHAGEVCGGFEDVGRAGGGGAVEVVRGEVDGQVGGLEVGATADQKERRRVVHLRALVRPRVGCVLVIGGAGWVPRVGLLGARRARGRVESGHLWWWWRRRGCVGGECVGEDQIAHLRGYLRVECGLWLEVDRLREEPS